MNDEDNNQHPKDSMLTNILLERRQHTSQSLVLFIFALFVMALQSATNPDCNPDCTWCAETNTSPLPIYIEQVINHEPVSPPSHPPSPPSNHTFNLFYDAPTLVKHRTNRILAYVGSFNPPHRGHLHLLKHVFTRGTHDMNVIAAIIIPASDESVMKKVQKKDAEFFAQ